MAKKKGDFVLIHRRITEWEWYKDGNTYRVFLHLIYRANWKPGRFRGIPIQRGQLVTSYPSLMYDLGLTLQEVRTAFLHLESTHEITREKIPEGLIITVKNYDRYQVINTQINTRSTHDQHTINTDRIKEQVSPSVIQEGNKESLFDSNEKTDDEWERMVDEDGII